MLSNPLSRRSLPLSARAVSRSFDTQFANRSFHKMPIAVPPTARGLSSTPSKSKAETSSTTAPSSKPLYASQSSLPHLPVPTLSSTFAKYLETIVPLQTSSEHSASKKLVNDFLSSPYSEELQKRLQKRAAERDSWLSEWWNEVAYMGYRGRIIPNVSYFYVHKRGLGKGKGQEERAAELVRATVEFKKLVDSGTAWIRADYKSELLEPEKGKAGPLCMASYKYLFNAVRVPTSPADIPLAYPPQLAHIVVIRNNRYFKVDTAGRSASQLADAFRKIKSIADSAPGSGLGVLTADDRDVWTEVRRHVMSLSKQNTEAIQTIESAILCVSLDGQDQLPTNEDERAWIYWSGGRNEEKKGHGWNRWFDKHDIIVDENGESGFNGEHSMLDGTPTLRLNEFLLASLEQGKIPLELSENERNQSPMPEPEEIVFELDQKAKEAIEQSTQGFQDEMSKQQLTMVHFTGYGKNAIKTYKSSPDAWAQMIKQLAFYRHFGRPGVTYESCMTRKYLLGRTEVIRSCSAEALAFVKAMEDPNVSDKERDALYRKAANRHIQYSAWAADGQGVDRHMFGLKMLVDKSKGEEMPAVFKEDVHGKSSHWEMSTSQLSSKWLDGWGYGEVVDDGYGLSYSIDDDSLRWCVTTKNGDAKAFAKRLEQAAEDMRAVMERAKSA